MTTTGYMQMDHSGTRRLAGILWVGLALFAPAALTGCASKPELLPPEVTVAPYASVGQDQPVFAVAPLRNESGVSFADALRVSDAVAARTAEIRGVACLPVNRTLAAMRAIRLSEVRTPEQARQLAQAVGADAIIVGSITAYDPYDPPKLGLTLGLFARDGSSLGRGPKPAMDVKSMQTRPDEAGWTASGFSSQPLSVVSEYLDAANHEVLMNVQRFAEGRYREGTALGWERYIKSMDLYTDFAANWAVRRLMQEERLRLARDRAPRAEEPKAR